MAWRTIVLAVWLLGVVPAGSAQQDIVPQDPQARTVRAARLTFVAGAVRVERSDNTAEDTPVLNMPLYEGTRVVTGDYGQVEIEFEDGSVVRMTPRSVLVLDDLGLADGSAKTQMALLGGLAYFELRKAAGYAYRIEAGGIEVTPNENTTVRVNLDEPPATIAVLSGAVRVEHVDGFRANVRTGESLRPDPTDETRYFLNSQVTPESWDRWNESRDETAADEAEKRTIARDGFAGDQGYGWSDLDANGSWYDVPDQGRVWQPAVADEQFDPYGYGSWVWGGSTYLFVSGYSWGWTPFRCGQWIFLNGFGWVWSPSRACGTFGYAGGGGWGGVHLGKCPPHYQTIVQPVKGPGKVHPIIVVHGPDGPRPPTRVGSPVLVGKVKVEPLHPVDRTTGRGSSAIGQTLNRDFPMDRTTGLPVLGRAPVAFASGDRSGGWHPVEGVRARPTETKTRPTDPRGDPVGGSRVLVGVQPGSSAPVAAYPAYPATGTASADRHARPVTTTAPTPVQVPPPPVRPPVPAPVQGPAPVHATPVQTAPVRVTPAPAPAAPAPVRSVPVESQASPKTNQK